MACEYDRQRTLAAAERRRLEKERKEALERIEKALLAGQARVVKQPGGRMAIVGVPLPNGMMDTCVLAKLQERNSQGFRQAVQKANAQSMNFVQMHNAMHQGGGGRGRGH